MTALAREPVSFVLAGENDLVRLRDLDPDRDWRQFQTGEHAWILQTFLRLRAAGVPVRLAPIAEGRGTVVFHAAHKHAIMSARRSLRDATLVSVRGDLQDPLIADLEVLQNGRFADGRRRIFVPHWPQPGLRPRLPERQARLERAAFKGFERNLRRPFREPAWREALAAEGIRWVVDAVEFRGTKTEREAVDWPDFTDIDLLVAVRPWNRWPHVSKPATKLVNAWLAGVPAILGREYSYLELRRSELDYIEASSPNEVLHAAVRLRDDPELYLAMVENGRRRAEEFTVPAVTRRWEDLLFDHLPRLAKSSALRRRRRLPLPVRRAIGKAQEAYGGRRSRRAGLGGVTRNR